MILVFGLPFVKQFALSYRTIVCLSVLSVTVVYCGQTVQWIKIKLGTQVGLDLGHNVLDADPAPPKEGSTASNFRPMSIVAKWSPISATAELLFPAATVCDSVDESQDFLCSVVLMYTAHAQQPLYPRLQIL